MNDIIKIDDLSIGVRRSSRRLNVDLTIERDGSISIAVPASMEDADIVRIIRQKLTWIYTALGRKEASRKGPPPKKYISGQGFFYLGKKYRLKVVRDERLLGSAASLQLHNDRFFLPRALVPQGHSVFQKWYSERASEWIGRRIQALRNRVAASPHSVTIRDLGFRWASCTQKGRMFFHWRTILLPPSQIDYIILHELVHLHEHNHSPAFYDRLRRASPDYRQHEDWLRRNGDLYSL